MTLPDFTEEQKRFIQAAKDVGLWGQVCSDAGAVRFGEALNQWLPIETAPKDGTEFDACNNFERTTNVKWGKETFDTEGKCKWVTLRRDYFHGFVWDEVSDITHWIPIPTAPKD